MERYIDGFVIPIPEGKLEDYKEMASTAGKIWMKHGALEYFECVGDDLDPDMGDTGMSITTFPQLMKTQPGETVLFSFIVYESREHRDEVNKKVMEDPEMKDGCVPENGMPFDPSKMAWGGFKTFVCHNS